MILPLVESVISYYQGPYLDNVMIIGVQHILETTHAMFRSLYKIGLKPHNISILGKCYSTCKEVYDEMIDDGIDVDPASFSYSSHISYDQHFQSLIEEFINVRLAKLSLEGIEKIIILDDGGKCIELIQKNTSKFPPLIAIEQTSSGYEAIRSASLSFPVINVAKSNVKLRLESPMIAEAAVQRLFFSLEKANYETKNALVLGGGSIGLCMQEKLKERGIVSEVYDIKNVGNQTKKFPESLEIYDLIVGCTGKTSVPWEYHKNISAKTALVSVSSSDREFDAVHLRRKIPETNDCHADLVINDILLVRNGFPVNFDGERENIDPQLIQLTIALMTSGILQAVEQDLLTSRGIIPLNKLATEFIENTFFQLIGFAKA